MYCNQHVRTFVAYKMPVSISLHSKTTVCYMEITVWQIVVNDKIKPIMLNGIKTVVTIASHSRCFSAGKWTSAVRASRLHDR